MGCSRPWDTGSFSRACDNLSPGCSLWLVPPGMYSKVKLVAQGRAPKSLLQAPAIPREAGSPPAWHTHLPSVTSIHWLGLANLSGQCWGGAVRVSLSLGPLHVEELCEGTDRGTGVGTWQEQPQYLLTGSRTSLKAAFLEGGGAAVSHRGAHHACT